MLQEAFEAQAGRTPNAVAVVAGNRRLSYVELDARANRLAHHLQALGVGPETRVGLCLQRDEQLVVAVLAVLKAGGAYVPLDPAYPAERLGFLLADSRAPVLITQQALLPVLPRHEAEVVVLEADAARIDSCSPARPRCATLPQNLSYFIYTSGSTGRAKGVAIAHRSAVALVRWALGVFAPEDLAGVALATSLCFDLSVFEIFVPLSAGGSVIVAANAVDIPRLPAAGEVTLVNTVPSAMAELVRLGAVPRSVRAVNLAGEALPGALVEAIYRTTSAQRVYNLYGPSEDTTYSTWALVAPDASSEPPIGRPVDGARAWLLDESGRSVPAGEPGEIFLGGTGLARGYFDRPDLTAERFVPDPFSGEPGARLYRTGDLARELPGGSLHFLGRIDHQVKIRGFRIELGEIEAVLLRHPAVREAVAVARDTPSGKQLVAYVAVGPPSVPSAGELREHLLRTLPEHMAPPAYVRLEALPRTPNGKVDRRALPEPDRESAGLESERVAPRTPLEERLAALFRELLHVEPGVHDDFFALGGHSLLAGQLVARVRAELGVELPLPDVYRAPTLAGLAERVAAAGQAEPIRIGRSPRGRPIPLTFQQERVWFLNELAPGGNIAYNFQATVRFRGRLRAEVLEAAMTEVVRRHEVFRTRFPAVDGVPVQEPLPPFPIRLPVVDLSALPADRVEAETEALIRRDLRRPFDLLQVPLVRWLLLVHGPEDHTLVQVEHHFVHDGWSFARLLFELRELYNAFAAGLPSPLPELPVQYGDFAVWQRSRMQGEALQRHVDHWREVLAGAPPWLELPADRPRPPLQSFRGAILDVWVDPALGWRLRAFAREHGATLFTTMFAGFALLMHRLSGEDDLVIGTAAADRTLAELEPMLGMMVNMLPLRVGCGGSPSFAALADRVQAVAVESFPWQDMPLERVVEALGTVRDPSRNPLFQVMFSFHDSPVPDLDFRGVQGELRYRHNASAKNDINVIGIPRAEQRVGRERRPEDDGLLLRWEYAADLFDDATLRRWVGQYERLLAAALDQPDRCADELPMLSEEETRQVLVEWNRTAIPLESGLLVHERVARRAEEAPDAPAVDSLTYGELVRRARSLACHLVRLGVEPESRVGVFAERSPEMVTGLLAVLNAGGAYLPIDPAYPPDRIAFVLDDARAPVLLTTSALAGRLPAYGGRVLLLDEELMEEIPGAGPLPAVDPGQLAYVIYTSGSTGRPKGVQIEHRSLLNLVEWHQREYGVGPPDRATLVASPGFDASVWEIWPCLTAGASLRVPPEAVRSEPGALAGWLVEERITISFLPTPLAEAVLEEDRQPPLRYLLTGGDALHRGADESAPFELVNHYGPTENTVVATAAPVERGARRPPIGRPISNVRVYVLDPRLQPQPAGVPGELFVGGSSLARGYLDRPDLTAERFVPDPFGEPGGRLYRTGDRVRHLPDGAIDFLGRMDFQVKVRGFRIELGEIEAVLREHPDVREAVVVARDEPLRLVAYVAADRQVGEELRELISARVPSYMVPSAFVVLRELPLGAHGKIDRAALPAPEAEAETIVEPRTPLERRLAAMWEELLPGGRVGIRDGFFERGGHSLLATRLLARVAREIGVSVPLGRFLQAPTVAELAVQVEAALGMSALAPAPRVARYPLSFPQQRLWFMDRLAPDSHTYNIPTAFRLRGPLDVAALIGAVSRVVDRHEVLRTRFVEVDGQPWQEVLPAGRFAVPLVDLSELPREIRERELARIGREEAAQPFVLSRGPLIRAGLVRMGPQDCVFLLTLHHIASDGWSEAILERELSALYQGSRPHSGLPALPIQYADFAVWQRSWPEEVLAGQVDWWSRRLAGATNLEVPTDRPRPPVQTFRGAIVGVALPAELSLALRDLARARSATPFIALLAAWQALFHRLTGQADVVVGSPVANRNRPEVEDLIGFFVNMLTLRTDCGGDPSFAELLGRVRSTALEAYDHADVPFERVIDELGLERDLSRQALAQVMFSLHTPAPPPALRGVESERIRLAGAVAKFDLTLALCDRGLREEDGFDGWIEYSTDLFDRSTASRLAGQLLRLLEAAAEHPDRRLSELDLLSPAERHQILGEWNDTAAPYPCEILIHQFFEAAVDRNPGALAAVWNGRELTYAGLEERANRIANLLGVERGTPVGIWMERSLDMVAGVLAVLKAGGWYVPLDPAWPADRVEAILRDMEAPALLTRSCHLGRVLEMQWRLPALSAVVCLDVETPEPAPEPVDVESIRDVFDLVAERAVDRVTAGGFVSSAGLPFSEAEVDEYRDRVLSLAEPWIGPDRRVLEIGVGSGLLMSEIAPRVARFVGLDPSPLTQERNRARGLKIELPVGFAHEIEGWDEGSFDLVLIASTAQFFPGPLYLERVIRLAERLLAPGGAVVIADVPDARYPHKVLSLPEEFFLDLGATVHHRTTGFDNELRYRYDVVLQRSKERGKSLLTSWHVERSPADRLPAVAAPEDLAYVIHTSGSTGQPKGIVVQHRPVANLIDWIGAESSDRVLFVTSLCFDLSVWDLFGVLAAGGCVHVASEEDIQDAERLMRILVEEPITIWDSAPAALVRLAPLFPSEPAVHSRLRRVMLSGDWIPVTLPDRVRAAFPHAEVLALGGATEATVWSNSYPVGEVNPEWPSIPYGRPMPNAQYRVLDAAFNPCPIGVPGDLYIGGDCLCVGYAHQPELTASAFLPDPCGAPGSRIYRTGDRARHFADGNLEFLGRIDHQVKIRGFRIELGEIEVALARHAAVREAVVLARKDVPGDKRLVAYVVPAGELPDLRDFLRQTLPDYMIPAAFVELEALPVTPNGKLDRKALPAPDWEGTTDGSAAPRTPTEQALAGLWREILGIEHVGVLDSFFDLGGHSLLATQLVARIRQTFRVELPLRAVFQAPALGELAAAVDVATLAADDAIHPIRREGELPLSASQLRQWFLVQLEPDSVDYNLPLTVRLEGDLQRGALAAALRALVQRHESLRTAFVAVEGRPAAVILPEIHLPLPLVDLSSAPEAVLAAVCAETDRPFDLARGPLLRALLIRLGEREHLLALTLHHIVFDGFSAGVLLRELAALYRGADLPPLAVQYVDYAAWQGEQLRGPAMQARIDRWRARLAGASQVLDLPTDRPRPAALSLRGEMTPVALAAEGTAAIRRLAAREGATLFMTLLAGYGALLSRYTGQDDLNVGTFVANRPRPELERLIGFFVNTLVLRVDLAGDPPFRELLGRVREMALEAFENQEVPFESLLDELETGRDLSRGPLFQAMFGLQNFALPTVEVPGLAFEPVSLLDHTRTNGDLGFWMWEEGNELTGLLQRSTDLFDASTVLRMYRHLERLLAAGAASPESRLSELPLLSAGETAQILVEWNVPGTIEPEPDALVHERVEHWARVRPNAVALETADGHDVLTWAELNRRGNQVAHRLGVRTDQVVGIWAERCVEFVVGVLGALKAGAAYMPLDPALPADRLAAILRGSGIPVLLARDGRPAELPPFEAEVLALRDLAGPVENPEPRAVPASLAYVLFTSGSTGTPKGVLIPHSALAGFAETARRLYGVGPEDRVLQFSSLVFDISVEEMFTSWVAGATLVLRSEEMVSSPARFLRAVGELEVQMVDLPTAYWHELGVELARGAVLPTCVRSVVFAGERALQERLAGWRDAMDHGVRLFNSYGPSETTPACSVFDPAEPAAGCSTNGLPIGRPMRGARLYATDPDLRPVPVGVAGELLIAGHGVGRGYAGRPDLTAERFVPDPFSTVPGERVYRSGDRVRWLRDGNLEFLGRVDDQVKVRGFRVEPGEIAAVICRHPAVREAVVVPRESAAGLRLVAYAAAEPGTAVAELRELIKSALPAYMAPADFVLLDALPLTATGKLDRKALPEPETGPGDEYAPPETDTEELLATIWAGLLDRERVGIFDDFFDLGGHSLLAPQVFARIEETFQVELPLRAMFEAPTVAQLANRIEQELLARIEGMSEEEAESLIEMERR